ncbi:hypothetical protein OB955_22095 [Halobacteria archaeon AArc-m2/3/4]|uniref:Uncharacterized protein n=1 Tax=Natronoglomus mannanivorans TaxID=2979990 RepID=A0ABT2QKD4_9EURY|nr:hypothetical protein [Halobacteria archaeon AArc-m2/3/4]
MPTRYAYETISDESTSENITPERPVTPGDLERAYCVLLEEVDR